MTLAALRQWGLTGPPSTEWGAAGLHSPPTHAHVQWLRFQWLFCRRLKEADVDAVVNVYVLLRILVVKYDA